MILEKNWSLIEIQLFRLLTLHLYQNIYHKKYFHIIIKGSLVHVAPACARYGDILLKTLMPPYMH
jgi:hypothetical protein